MADRAPALCALVTDRDVEPGSVSGAGWSHLLRDTDMLAGEPEHMARRTEASTLALALLTEDVVAAIQIEQPLTRLRLLNLHADCMWRKQK
jgi:hypothetical protein